MHRNKMYLYSITSSARARSCGGTVRALWPAAKCAALQGRTHGCTDQCCNREESSCQLRAVHTWHLASIRTQTLNVRFRGIPDFGWPPNSTPSDTERAALAPLG